MMLLFRLKNIAAYQFLAKNNKSEKIRRKFGEEGEMVSRNPPSQPADQVRIPFAFFFSLLLSGFQLPLQNTLVRRNCRMRSVHCIGQTEEP